MGYIKRKPTRTVDIGGVKIGGGNPVAIQSMCNTDTRDAKATIEQIKALEEEGCEIIRVAVPDMAAAEAIGEIKKGIGIPLVADIHFDYRLALKCLEMGVDKLRINPGNIGGRDRVEAVVNAARVREVPIRIGVNSGSLEKELLESALRHIAILEELNYDKIVVSIKASNVSFSMEAYSLLSEKSDYPVHLGITEAGTVWSGTIKSAAGIGAILGMGIGDTVRVSLTGDPIEEVRAAKEILKAMELRKFGISFVSCPTCGRTEIDLIGLASRVEEECRNINKDIKVAVMGCAVNGPGEAREADIGIAGGKGYGLIFKKGEILRKLPEDELLPALMEEIAKL